MNTMDNSFQHLRFERPLARRLPRWGIPFVLVPGLFTLLWLVVPHSTLYWPLLIICSVLSWVAGYGWRQALVSLIDLLQRLEQM